mgnify:CR=1 FL=1
MNEVIDIFSQAYGAYERERGREVTHIKPEAKELFAFFLY